MSGNVYASENTGGWSDMESVPGVNDDATRWGRPKEESLPAPEPAEVVTEPASSVEYSTPAFPSDPTLNQGSDWSPRTEAEIEPSRAPSRSAGLIEDSKSDPVNHPDHYQDRVYHAACGQQIECIDVIECFALNPGSVIKYIWRAGAKGDAIEDLKKARWYIDRMIDNIENDRPVNDLR